MENDPIISHDNPRQLPVKVETGGTIPAVQAQTAPDYAVVGSLVLPMAGG